MSRFFSHQIRRRLATWDLLVVITVSSGNWHGSLENTENEPICPHWDLRAHSAIYAAPDAWRSIHKDGVLFDQAKSAHYCRSQKVMHLWHCKHHESSFYLKQETCFTFNHILVQLFMWFLYLLFTIQGAVKWSAIELQPVKGWITLALIVRESSEDSSQTTEKTPLTVWHIGLIQSGGSQEHLT